MFWSSEEGVAFGDGNRAEFPSPGVHILKQKMMDKPQMIRVKTSTDWVFVKLEESCEEMVTFKLAQMVRISNVGKVEEDRRILV